MAKKRRTKEQIARSERAKRGWVTRREKQALLKQISNATTLIRNAKKGVKGKKKKKVIAKLPKKPRKKKGKKQSIEELQSIIELQKQQIEILTLTKDWEHAMPPEFLHPDGTIALYPCRARHWGGTTAAMLVLLQQAYDVSNTVFDRTVSMLAEQFNMPMREVYTLWFSP